MSDRVRFEATPDLVGIPDHHVVERHAHLVGRVAAEVLIGQEEHTFAPLPRPPQRRRRVRRCADDAAALAAERFDGSGRVDVGDRQNRLLLPAGPWQNPHLLEIAPAVLELFGPAMSDIEQPAAGRAG